MNNLRKHKGYQGEVIYEDGTLIIRVLHVDDFLTTECHSATDAQSSFECLVDEYLEDCASLGREPKKPYSGTLNVRIGPDLHRAAAIAALEQSKSLNAWISSAVEEKLARGAEIVSAARQMAALPNFGRNSGHWEARRSSARIRTAQEPKMFVPGLIEPTKSASGREYD